MSSQRPYPRFDFSGGVQSTTSYLLKKPNEVKASKNADFRKIVGAITRRNGYEQVGDTIQSGKDGLYAGVYRYGSSNKIVVGINDATDTNAELRYLAVDDSWTTILSDADPNTRFNCLNSLDEFYVAGATPNGTYYELNLVKDDLTTTRTYNVLNAPKCKYIAEFQGRLVAINCEVGGTAYPDRAYLSSPPLGAITFVQTDQSGTLTELRVDSVRYLKSGMTVDIYTAGTNTAVVTNLAITGVDKKNNKIQFASTSVTVEDNDEIWLDGRKDKLTRFWNTDYPTAETAEFLAIPVPEDSETVPEIIGYGKNSGRLLLFTPDSMHKYDGANLVPVSETVGCVSHESIKNISKWTLFFHTSGVWGYNDETGQLKLLSRSIEKYIQAIQPSNYAKISAVTIDRVYKLAVGELSAFEESTTPDSGQTEVVRLIYDFDSNIWWPEYHGREFRFQFRHRLDGAKKPFFIDETGRLWQDDTGNLDGTVTIPFEVEFGRDNFGMSFRKSYHSYLVDSDRAAGVQVFASIDGGSFEYIGQVTERINEFPFKYGSEGWDINYKFTHNANTAAPIINADITYWSPLEGRGDAG